MTYSFGSDIGGTFTDFAVVNQETGELRINKCLTTPADPSEGVQQGTLELNEMVPGCLAETSSFVHGTTLVINSVIERKGAVTGLLTTEGFRDVIEIGREKRFDGYDLQIRFPDPLVPRYLRKDVTERLHVSGDVLTPLDEAQARTAIQELIDAGVESIAVSFLHSFQNTAHELRMRELIEEIAPDMPVSLSCEVLPEIREYERTSTTCVNAYTRPLINRYIKRLDERLGEHGFGGQLLLMLSSGGVSSAETARRFPVQVIESGPAAGIIGAAHYARQAGLDKILSFDMGGTTAKMGLLKEGRVAKTSDYEVARVFRFKRGSGIPVRVPVVDMIEIGTGGGSIASISEVGTLRVGPRSAGASPGPACYGLGGEKPTVSDANLVLGYLSADYFLGGEMKLDLAAAEAAIKKEIADPLNLSVIEAAWGIHDIADENMGSASKVYITEHGEGPEDCTLVGFGGAGPIHACDLARRIGLGQVLIPPYAGVASAVGMIVAPIANDTVRTFRIQLEAADLDELKETYKVLAEETLARLPASVDPAQVTYQYSMDMRYVGQGFEVNVPLGSGETFDFDKASVQAAFDKVYQALYGRVYSDLTLEIVNLRLTAEAPAMLQIDSAAAGSDGADPLVGERSAYCPDAGAMVPHPVYRRAKMPVGFEAAGPAIVEERESTTIVRQGWTFSVDDGGSLVMKLAKPAAE